MRRNIIVRQVPWRLHRPLFSLQIHEGDLAEIREVLSWASFLEGADECTAGYKSIEAPWLAITSIILLEAVEVVLAGPWAI